MAIKTYSNPETLSNAAAQLFVDLANESVKKRGRFTVALSGGGSPQRMYELLASEPLKSKVPWNKTVIFWGDERFVPADDPQNNARMTREKLLDHVSIPLNQIYPIPTSGAPAEAVRTYEQTLGEVFTPDELPRFDFMLLGLGENGHTASLFPHTKVLHEYHKWVDKVYVEEKDQYRITLTVPVINNSRNIIFIAYSQSKAPTIRQVIKEKRNIEEYPAQLINPSNGLLLWMLDEDAAAELDNR